MVNRNINFTNICYTGCRFCAFAQRPSDADADEFDLDEFGELQAWELGVTEVCLQGGIDPKLPAYYYVDIVNAIRTGVSRPAHTAFSPMEMPPGSARGLRLPSSSVHLKEAGLARFLAQQQRSSMTT